MRNDQHDASLPPSLIHCGDCGRKCVDLGERLLQYGWRSESVAGKTHWHCSACLGAVPDVAALFKTVRSSGSRAA